LVWVFVGESAFKDIADPVGNSIAGWLGFYAIFEMVEEKYVRQSRQQSFASRLGFK
jgi:hypothetical protein